jgi:hypothetical protein
LGSVVSKSYAPLKLAFARKQESGVELSHGEGGLVPAAEGALRNGMVVIVQ